MLLTGEDKESTTIFGKLEDTGNLDKNNFNGKGTLV